RRTGPGVRPAPRSGRDGLAGLAGVGQHLEPALGLVGRLEPAPVVRRQQVGVMGEELVAQLAPQPEEVEELLREDVVRADVEPGLAPGLVLVEAGPGQVTVRAVGDQAQLVVVVEDDPA
ncbi:hypothetical protein RZS08_00645, partial [Arthrospira platensis SPKY1]|nr:hypothetical protein [Arthrospira platensis SPKY1]